MTDAPQSANPEASTDTSAGDVSGTAVVKPEYLPDQFWSADDASADFGAFRSEFDTLSQFKADSDARIAALPADVDGYEIGLPEGFTVPEGTNYEFNTDDPRVGPLKEWAHKNQIAPDALKELIGLHAGHDIESIKAQTAAAQAEMAKLGDNPKERIKTLTETLNSHLPKANASALADVLSSYEAIVAVDLLLGKARGTAQPAQPQNKNAMSSFEGMSIDEKMHNLPGRGR